MSNADIAPDLVAEQRALLERSVPEVEAVTSLKPVALFRPDCDFTKNIEHDLLPILNTIFDQKLSFYRF